MTWTESRTAEMARSIVAAKEKYILDFFGSAENAERFGKDYVFEEYEIEHNISDHLADAKILTFRQKYRLRRKTDEERAAEQERESKELGDD